MFPVLACFLVSHKECMFANCWPSKPAIKQFYLLNGGYIYHKSSIKPPGTYLISDTPEAGIFKKLDKEDIYDSFIILLPHILQIQDAILQVKYMNLTDFYPKLYQN